MKKLYPFSLLPSSLSLVCAECGFVQPESTCVNVSRVGCETLLEYFGRNAFWCPALLLYFACGSSTLLVDQHDPCFLLEILRSLYPLAYDKLWQSTGTPPPISSVRPSNTCCTRLSEEEGKGLSPLSAVEENSHLSRDARLVPPLLLCYLRCL